MKISLIALVFISCLSCQKNNNPTNNISIVQDSFIRAADISFLPEIEGSGSKFYDANGNVTDVLSILKQNGCNTVRLRLWHNPTNNHSNLSEVKKFAATIKQKGLQFWLDIHYSDTWTDPSQQTKPIAWQGLSFTDLKDSVYRYTQRIVTETQPDLAQIGNEINNGFLWNDGNIADPSKFLALLKSGIAGCRLALPSAKIMIHYAGYEGADWFFGLLQNSHTDYDMIGLSYYPIWHGKSIDTLQMAMQNLNKKYSKSIVIAETAYPFTLGWNDYTNNIVGLQSQLIPAYAATIDGQLNFLMKLKQTLQNTNGGKGFCYWAPEWVAFKGTTSNTGSTWENQALFDFNNRAVKAMQAFGQ